MSPLMLGKFQSLPHGLRIFKLQPLQIARHLLSPRYSTASKINMGGLEVTTNNGIQVIKLNRPEKKNAITVEMYNEFIDTLNQSATDNNVHLTVITGSGDYYSSGNDFNLSHFSDMEKAVEKATTTTRRFVDAFIDYPKLLIAVVNGPAIGIAATTLALCDVVYSSDKAWFKTPFTQLGLVPEGCSTFTFPRLMGAAKASMLLYLNETLSANEALTCGFVTELFPDSQLQVMTSKKIDQFTKLPLESLQESKKLVRGWDKQMLHQVNELESKKLGERFLSDDFLNAILAFNKRKSKL